MVVPPFQLDLSPPDEETQKLAEVELRETPENVATGLAELRKLLAEDSSIYYKDDDQILTMFLRPCKWYAQSAYELMKRIADFKIKHKKILEGLTPQEEIKAFTDQNVVNVLKNVDHKGRRVLIVNTGASWDPSKVSTDEMFRVFYLVHQAALMEPTTQIRGVVVIMDYDGMGMKQAKAFGPSYALLLLSFIQDAMPLRLKEVHMVKEPFIFNMVWSIFKPFIREKLKKRIFFHGSKMASLHKHIPPTHLPSDYGGVLPEIDYSAKEWTPFIENHVVDFITELKTFGATAKK